MARLAIAFLAAALVLGVSLCDEVSEKEMGSMSHQELVEQFSKLQQDAALTRTQLATANGRISELTEQLTQQRQGAKVTEAQRVAAEREKKTAVKKKEAMKRAQKLKKKQRLEDILMEHTAEFVAMKIAKKYSHKDAKTQKAEVKKEALKAARAGAAGPLRKVARTMVAAAVKKSRKENKAAGEYNKKVLHKASLKAAKAVFSKIMKKQNTLVQQTVEKVTKKALAKYPAAMAFAEDEEPTQAFTAPPSIHIGLFDDETPAPKPVPKTASKAKEPSPKSVAKAASKAKADAAEIVPEK